MHDKGRVAEIIVLVLSLQSKQCITRYNDSKKFKKVRKEDNGELLKKSWWEKEFKKGAKEANHSTQHNATDRGVKANHFPNGQSKAHQTHEKQQPNKFVRLFGEFEKPVGGCERSWTLEM